MAVGDTQVTSPSTTRPTCRLTFPLYLPSYSAASLEYLMEPTCLVRVTNCSSELIVFFVDSKNVWSLSPAIPVSGKGVHSEYCLTFLFTSKMFTVSIV